MVVCDKCSGKLSKTHGLKLLWSVLVSINEALLKYVGVVIFKLVKYLFAFLVPLFSHFLGLYRQKQLLCLTVSLVKTIFYTLLLVH